MCNLNPSYIYFFSYFGHSEDPRFQMEPGLAQQNLGPKAKILYGAFLYVNILIK